MNRTKIGKVMFRAIIKVIRLILGVLFEKIFICSHVFYMC